MRGPFAMCLILAGVLTVGCTIDEPQPSPPSPPQVTAPAQAGLAMGTPRASHTATPLPGGRVLIIGGCVVDHCDGTAGADSELFDPATGRFTPGALLSTPRAGHTATALTDGRVLVVGGFSGERLPPLASAEVYNPVTGRFEPAETLSVRRAEHTATRLLDGRVLIAGGADGTTVLAGAEIYDPATGRFGAAAALPGPRSMHGATLLADGRVLVAGGQSARGTLLDTAAVYDPANDSWRDVGRLDAPKYKLALASLPDGGALVVGGQTADDPQARLARTERFDPRSGTFRPGPQMSEPRYKIFDAVLTLADGRVVIAGGYGVDIYADGALRALGTVPGPERQSPAVAALPDGRVLITGGYDDRTFLTATAVVVQP
ncbi:kelch repeat-containing protein [Dactylosporangium sp. NPDC005572]|uniref:Kelch repeat-containing protein n=1 Tax=Dactylosporangium sp. NPDC005572 TaxID=3156889 RepID=UPI0033ADA6EE